MTTLNRKFEQQIVTGVHLIVVQYNSTLTEILLNEVNSPFDFTPIHI